MSSLGTLNPTLEDEISHMTQGQVRDRLDEIAGDFNNEVNHERFLLKRKLDQLEHVHG